MPRSAPIKNPANSTLCASGAQRLSVVAVLLVGLWLAVYWALLA